MMSGLVLNKDVKWLTFHSSYDFGYLLKTLTGTDLPSDEASFLEIFHLYFPCSYDLKVSESVAPVWFVRNCVLIASFCVFSCSS